VRCGADARKPFLARTEAVGRPGNRGAALDLGRRWVDAAPTERRDPGDEQGRPAREMQFCRYATDDVRIADAATLLLL
jgi:hypothetical protein